MQHPILKPHPEQAGKAVLAEHEVVFLRDGAIPDNLRSFNSRAGFFEGGVSVLPCVQPAGKPTRWFRLTMRSKTYGETCRRVAR